MINTLLGALTLATKIGICIAVFAVIIIAEIIALVSLVKWRKKYKAVGVQNADKAAQKQNEDAQIAESNVNRQNENAVEEVEQSSVNDENSEEDLTAIADGAEPTANEDVDVAQQDQEKKDGNMSMFAFAPVMFMSAATQVTNLRYLLYGLIGLSVVLGAAVLITAIVLAKSLNKAPKTLEEQPAELVQQPQEPVEEQIDEVVEQPTETVETAQETAEESVEQTDAEEIAEEAAEVPLEEPVEEQIAEEEIVAESEPFEEDEVTVDEAEEVAETQPIEEEVVEEQPVVEEIKPVEETKPVKELVKRQPPAREQTIIVDDKPVLIKDDRFLFNPEEDGFYYVLEKTFTAKLIQSEEYAKDYYTEIKNELLSYKKVHSRMSKKRESFNFGRNCLARLTIRGKTLRLHLALDAKDYEETKYKVEDMSEVKSLADTALMYRIKNDRRVKYAKDLIAAVMEKYGVPRQDIEPINYTDEYPYETTEALLARALIKHRRVQGIIPENGGFDFAQKTFKAKLIQSDDIVKEYYSQIKNHLLSFKKIHDRMSKKRESYRFGRVCVARMTIRGKTLKLYLALNAKDYEDTKYKVEDASDVKSFADTPLVIKIKNPRRLKYALELIDTAMESVGTVKKQKADETDYAAELPFENTEELYEKGLIVDVHVQGNSFIAQHFAASAHKATDEAAADEDEE
ncbi:MAG: hypothetical protein OSJ74_00840 [Clostridia bacterium]|nr:hypothetical protein [Clostridia bacterium]